MSAWVLLVSIVMLVSSVMSLLVDRWMRWHNLMFAACALVYGCAQIARAIDGRPIAIIAVVVTPFTVYLLLRDFMRRGRTRSTEAEA